VAQQPSLTSDIENLQIAEPMRKVNGQQTYRSPEVVDLGKASELLQGGSSIGRDNFNQTQW
jgi:hypothetical protein